MFCAKCTTSIHYISYSNLCKSLAFRQLKEVLCRSFPINTLLCWALTLNFPNQRVVTYMSPIEAFATAIKFFDQQKVCLIVPFWGSWSLDFQGPKVKLQQHVLDRWFLAVWRSPWSLDRPLKRALIAWFSFDPGRKRFYTGHISVTILCKVCFWGGVSVTIHLKIYSMWWKCVFRYFQEPTEILLGKPY